VFAKILLKHIRILRKGGVHEYEKRAKNSTTCEGVKDSLSFKPTTGTKTVLNLNRDRSGGGGWFLRERRLSTLKGPDEVFSVEQ